MYTASNAPKLSTKAMAIDTWEPRSVAYHEAAHAVVAWVNRLQIDEITIDPAASAGHVLHEGYTDDMNPEWTWGPATKQRILDQLQVCLAGEEAQRRLGDEETDIEAAAAHDRYARGDHMLALTNDLDEQSLYWNLLEYQVRRIVEANWYLIEALAQSLLERKTMTGKEANAVLRKERDRKLKQSRRVQR